MSLKILLVDDEVSVLKLLKSMIEPLGCEVLTMTDSREAAKRIDQEKFDGVFTDASMPFLDGFELTRHTRRSAHNRNAPVVMITGYDDVATMRKGFDAGITFFLGKPFDQDKIYGLFKVMRGPMLTQMRRYARVPVRIPVMCQPQGEPFPSCTLNIGAGGMLLEFSGGSKAGDTLLLRLTLPGNAVPVTVKAKVIRVEPPDRAAVEFGPLQESDKSALEDFIAQRVKG
jgi:CheY-like chemotaxis protein